MSNEPDPWDNRPDRLEGFLEFGAGSYQLGRDLYREMRRRDPVMRRLDELLATPGSELSRHLVREMMFDPVIRQRRRELRRELGFRAVTRLDELIFQDGTVVKETPDGSFVGVRCGLSGWDSPDLRWL